MVLLRHIHGIGPIAYGVGSRIQDRLVRLFLDSKSNSNITAPSPTVLTTQFWPTYTCGRREVGTVSTAQQEYLKDNGRAEFHEALRGGQTTFHGPGQLVAYPILDLKQHNLTARSYVCLLEKTLIKTCARYGISTMTTEHPGVWTTPDSKIAALGIHLRRNISSHGIGLNVNTDLSWFDRIVACGLEGKRTTSLNNEGVSQCNVDDVARTFVSVFADSLHGISGVQDVPPEDSLLSPE